MSFIKIDNKVINLQDFTINLLYNKKYVYISQKYYIDNNYMNIYNLDDNFFE